MSVFLQSEVASLAFDLSELEEEAQNLLRLAHCQEKELSVLLVDDRKMTELNDQYRGKKKATNVLSFPMLDDDGPLPGPAMLGDIVISIDTALREAENRAVSLTDYLIILLVHGLVHLLGFDHERGTEEAQQMAAKEKELLQKFHSSNKLTPLTG